MKESKKELYFHIRTSPEVKEMAEELAESLGRSVSNLITHLIVSEHKRQFNKE